MKKVELFIPLVMDQFFSQTAFNTVKLLERAGCEVVYDALQTTSGIEAYDAGYWDESKEVASKFLSEFSGNHYIVTPSVSTVGMVKEGFNDLFTNSPEHNICRNIQRNIFEITDYLVNIAKQDYFGAEFVATAVFHAGCSSWSSYQSGKEAIKLLEQVGGLELLDDTVSHNCKMGRSNAVGYEAISVSLGEEVIRHAIDVHAEYIICNDVDCMIHLQGIIDQQEVALKTIHIVDVLTSGLPNV